MKQGKLYTTFILLALAAAILCYLGYAVFSSLDDQLATVLAVEYEAGAGCHTQGFVVRDETVLSSQYAITVLGREEGERVGMGQTVATGYQTSDAQQRQALLETLTAQLDQLRYASAYGTEAVDAAGLDEEIRASLSACAQYAARRDLSAVAERSGELKGLILRHSTDESDLSSIQAQIDTIEAQIQQLQTSATTDTMRITAPVSGYFSGTADGYEAVLTSERLTSITAAELDGLGPAPLPDNASGRLITSAVWHYVTAVPSTSLEDAAVGDQVSLSFTSDFYRTLQMRISRIGDDEDGRRLLVLESTEYIQDVTKLRAQSADVVFNSYVGLRVPKNALHLNEQDEPGVYVLESVRAKWKPVEILYDNGESYVVKLDTEDTNNLWPGDAILVNTKNLYDGKVVSAQ